MYNDKSVVKLRGVEPLTRSGYRLQAKYIGVAFRIKLAVAA
jgi:hypothetical protein